MSDSPKTPGSSPRRVFLDTSAIKLATVGKMKLRRVDRPIYREDRLVGMQQHEFVVENPTEKLKSRPFKAEVDLLPAVAHAARGGLIELVTSVEVFDELMRVTFLPGRETNVLRDAGIGMVPPPFEYSRPLLSRTYQVAFMARIRHPRFLDWRRVSGANQGNRIAANQLLDAFHLWTAEAAGVSDFLTCDLKLIRVLRRQRKFKSDLVVVTPSELLARVGWRGLDVLPASST